MTKRRPRGLVPLSEEEWDGCARCAVQYARVQKLARQFRDENGSIVCRELLGLAEHTSCPVPEKRTKAYYRKRPCAELVACAAEFLDQELQKNI